MVAGCVEGRIDGRPFTLSAYEQTLRLSLDSIGDAWRSRRAFARLERFGQLAADHAGLRLEIVAGGAGPFPVFPTAHWLVRPFLT
ncbi:MAG: hypothetical protein AAF266_14710 [Planctomycetota bacterium]